jgi:hypothetical protein
MTSLMMKLLEKRGEATELKPNSYLGQILNQPGYPSISVKARTRYPEAHDEPDEFDDNGLIYPEVGEHSTEDVEVRNLFEQKVKELVEAAGGKYKMPPDQETPPPKYLVAAVRRLEHVAPVIQRAMECSERREYGNAVLEILLRKHDDGDGDANKLATWGRVLRSMRLRRHETGSVSGSISADASESMSGDGSSATGHGSFVGSQCGEINKTTVLRALQGHQNDALKLMGRR